VTCLDEVTNRRGRTRDVSWRGDEGKNILVENQTPIVQLTLKDIFHPRISLEGPNWE
jgi:hypothetical protein